MFIRAKVASLLAFLAACTIIDANAHAQTTTAKPPAVVEAVVPVYPTMIVGRSEVERSGVVIVETKLDGAGAVTSAKPVAGDPLLRRAAVQAAQQWVFAPANEGEGVRTVRLYFKFNALSVSEPEPRLHPSIRLGSMYWVEVSRYSVKEVRGLQSRNRRSKRQ